MLQSSVMLSVMSQSGNILPAPANIRQILSGSISIDGSIDGGMVLPVDFHVFRIGSAGQVHALCVAVGRSVALVRSKPLTMRR